MNMISRLEYARERANALFDSTCTVYRSSVVLYSEVPCSVEDANLSTQRLDGENLPADALLVAVPVDGYLLQPGDYIVEKGRTLEVTLALSPISMEVRQEVICVRAGAV